MLEACRNIEAEIFVIDNHSTDGSKDFFTNRFPQVQFIWKNENAGFAKANNEVLKQVKGEKILFLNPDTILPEDCMEKCLHFFYQQKNAGALGVRMIDGSGNFLPESKRGFPSAFTSFCKMSGLIRLFPRSPIFASYYLGQLPENKTNEVDVLSGAFMMIEKKVLDIAGSFDEEYFMYAEDIDLSFRIQRAGYKNFYFTDTAIIHFKGESTVKQTADYTRNFYGAMKLFVKKHYGVLSGKLYVLVLNIFISTKSMFAKQAKKDEVKLPAGKAFVIAGKETFKENELALLQYFDQVERIENIEQAEKKSSVIFCEPYISFKAIIALMQQYKNQYGFFIHSGTTISMVGSSNKNQPGSAILL